jgi:hypothetical protein
MSVKCPM